MHKDRRQNCSFILTSSLGTTLFKIRITKGSKTEKRRTNGLLFRKVSAVG